jgi:serine/threonine-protein phosphatase 6 regulatory subunit 3
MCRLPAASPVDSILDKESFSLEELLDEDELIQECKSLNARLVTYLRQSSTVEQLVRAGMLADD